MNANASACLSRASVMAGPAKRLNVPVQQACVRSESELPGKTLRRLEPSATLKAIPFPDARPSLGDAITGQQRKVVE